MNRVWARQLGQLWYELFSFSSNLSPSDCQRLVQEGTYDDELNSNSKAKQFIIGMHPHGIVPFHAVLWSAYCDQYLQYEGRCKSNIIVAYITNDSIVLRTYFKHYTDSPE